MQEQKGSRELISLSLSLFLSLNIIIECDSTPGKHLKNI